MENLHLGSRNVHSRFRGKRPTRFLMCKGKLGQKGQEFSKKLYTITMFLPNFMTVWANSCGGLNVTLPFLNGLTAFKLV